MIFECCKIYNCHSALAIKIVILMLNIKCRVLSLAMVSDGANSYGVNNRRTWDASRVLSDVSTDTYLVSELGAVCSCRLKFFQAE